MSFVSVNKTRQFIYILSLSIVLVFCLPLCYANAPAHSAKKEKSIQSNETILNVVPSNCIGAYISFRTSIGEQKAVQMLASLISAAGLSGAFNINQQIIADIAYITIQLSKYPHAIFIQDVSAKQLGADSFALANLSGGVIIQAAKEKHIEFLNLLKTVIDHYFTSADAKIIWAGEGKYRHQKLTAKEFPEWASWEWISLNNYFLFTIGHKAFEDAIKTIEKTQSSINTNKLVKLANEYDNDIANRIVIGYIDLARLRTMLNPVMKETLDNVLNSLDASELNRWLFSAGFTQKAFISKIYLQWKNSCEMGYLTNRLSPNSPLYKAIPQQANIYGVSYIDVSEGVNSIVNTYLQSRNSKRRDKLIRNYNKIMHRAGLGDVSKLIFRHLGPVMLIHDWPTHPLSWPFAMTFVIQHDGSKELMNNWNKVLPAWQTIMRKIANNDKLKNVPVDISSIFSLQLDKTEDNIWFAHIGPLVLAAMGLQERFLVISHSPLAVRVNIRFLDSVFSDSTSKPINRQQ